MKILLNYRQKNERIEEAFYKLGHSIVYNLWDISEIMKERVDLVIFEFKQIVKEELKFLNLSLKLNKNSIPRVTWCLDIPNIGARQWKISAILKLRLVDIFATHSLQGLPNSTVKMLYLPNAAWISRYNLMEKSLEEFRNPDIYKMDVSFLGNIDATKYPEHKHRMDFLISLAKLLEKDKITFRFIDSRHLDINAQIEAIQTSKINLNYGSGADRYEIKSWGLPERCYGIPACGGFLLCEERVHAKDDFVKDKEIVMFKNLEDCFYKIKYYIDSPMERRKIAENAYKKVLSEHTYRHRAEKLINAVQTL